MITREAVSKSTAAGITTTDTREAAAPLGDVGLVGVYFVGNAGWVLGWLVGGMDGWRGLRFCQGFGGL
jgi:hypothetical protein